MNDFAELKEKAKKTWSDFASMENFTGVAAPTPTLGAPTSALLSPVLS